MSYYSSLSPGSATEQQLKPTILQTTWTAACRISWTLFIAYQIGIGCDRLLSEEPLCPYNASQFGGWYWYTCFSCLGGFMLVWCIVLLKIVQMEPDNKRIPLWVALNIVSMGTVATFLALVWDWGGVCVDLLNVSSPAAIWGEWMACGPLLLYITITISDTPRLTQFDYFLMICFFLCLLTGFLIIIPQPLALAQFWLVASCLLYVPLLVLPWYKGEFRAGPTVCADERKPTKDEMRSFAARYAIRRNLSIWLTIVLPLYTVNYLVAFWGGIDYAMTIVIYQVLSVLTKGLFAAVTMDIHLHLLLNSERVLLEERRANNARREFMKYIFHEVRTPLNSITMGIDLLDGCTEVGENEQGYIEMMRSATAFMSDTLNNVLSLQKIEEGMLELEISPFDIRKSVTKVLNTMHGSAVKKQITLKAVYASTISPRNNINSQSNTQRSNQNSSPHIVHADMHRIEHVISNLVSNAIKFSPEKGTIQVEVAFEAPPIPSTSQGRFTTRTRTPFYERFPQSVMHIATSINANLNTKGSSSGSKANINAINVNIIGQEAQQQHEPLTRDVRPAEPKDSSGNVLPVMNMTVSVTDLGQGISLEDQARLFNNFVQLRPGTLQQGQGSGLGLSFVKKIVQLHGGTVSVESEEGKGSTFKFTIPVPVEMKKGSPMSLHLPPVSASVPSMASLGRLVERMVVPSSRKRVDVEATVENKQDQVQEGPAQEYDEDLVDDRNGPRSFLRGDYDQNRNRDLIYGPDPHSRPDSRSRLRNFDINEDQGGVGQGEDQGGAPDFKPRGGALTVHRSASFLASPTTSAIRTECPPLEVVPEAESNTGRRPADMVNNTISELCPDNTGRVEQDTTELNKNTSDSLLTLVVDDAEINRKMLIALLKKMGITSEGAGDGQVALGMIKQDVQKYSLVLMDNLMPNMNGAEATQAMRAAGYIGIIAGVTGNVMVDDVNEYLIAGADIVYSKPLKLAALQLLIDHIKENGSMSLADRKLIEQGNKLEWVSKQNTPKRVPSARSV